MAKAVATCTCKTCGETFEKSVKRSSRREADNWIAFAVNNYDECPACYAKRKREEEKDAGLRAILRLGSPLDDKPVAYAVLFGDTYPIKDNIKSIGAYYTDNYPADAGILGSLGLSLAAPQKRWVLEIGDDKKLAELEALGFAIECPSETDIIMWRSAHEIEMKNKAENDEIKNQAMDQIGEIPAWPDEIKAIWPAGTKWNGKVYGKPGNYNVYFSGDKVEITDEQKETLEKKKKKRERWREFKKSVDNIMQ